MKFASLNYEHCYRYAKMIISTMHLQYLCNDEGCNIPNCEVFKKHIKTVNPAYHVF